MGAQATKKNQDAFYDAEAIREGLRTRDRVRIVVFDASEADAIRVFLTEDEAACVTFETIGDYANRAGTVLRQR